MYINVEDDIILKYYQNYDKKDDYYKEDYSKDIMTPKEGLNIGNMFYNLYEPYKNYKPRELRVKSEKEQLLLKIQEFSFAVNDLNLYLDLYPNDKMVFELFKQYNLELNKLNNIYSEKFEVIEINQDIGNSFTWYKNPWPWEVMD